MAQLKSTSVTGNLSVTGNVVASQIIKNDGTNDQILLAGGNVKPISDFTTAISNAQTTANTATSDIATMKENATLTTFKDIEAKIASLTTTDIDGIDAYATDAELLQAKIDLLGAENYSGTIQGAYVAAAGAQAAAETAQTAANTAQTKADEAYDLADTKTTMDAVKKENYATKTEALGYATAVLGSSTDGASKNTVYGAKAAASNALNKWTNNTYPVYLLSAGSGIDSYGSLANGVSEWHIGNTNQNTTPNGKLLLYSMKRTVTNTGTVIKPVYSVSYQSFTTTIQPSQADCTITLPSKTGTLLVKNGDTMTGPLTISTSGTNPALANGGSSYDKIIMASNGGTLGFRTKKEFVQDLSLSLVYNYRGTKLTLEDLKDVSSASIGDVWFVLETGDNWACYAAVTTATGADYETYWSNLGKNVDLSGYMTLATDQTIIGSKTFTKAIERNYTAESTDPVLKIGSSNQDVTLFQIYSSNLSHDTHGVYGYNLIYEGTGAGKANYLTLYCDNETAIQPVIGWQVDQQGYVGIATEVGSRTLTVGGDTEQRGSIIFPSMSSDDPDSYWLTPALQFKGVHEPSYAGLQFIDNRDTSLSSGTGLILNGSGSTYIGSGESGTNFYKYKFNSLVEEGQQYEAIESKYLYLCSNQDIYFYTNCQIPDGKTVNDIAPKATIYNTNGDWTMPRNLILARGTDTDVCIEFTRGTAADWKLLSSDSNFKIQCDYTTASASKEYYDVINLNQDSGNMYVKGSIVSSSADQSQYLGSSSKRWKSVYCYDLNEQITLSKTNNEVSMNEDTSLNAHYGLNWTNATWAANGIITLSGAERNGDGWNFLIDDTATYDSALSITTKYTEKVLLECIADEAYEVNIPQGKLGLSSANFIYNSIDKCIDITFT